MKKVILIIAAFFVFANISAFKDRDVLFKRANRYYIRKQYQSAIELYKLILKDHPEDKQTIEKLVNSYINSSSLPKAHELLEQKKQVLSEFDHLKLLVRVLLKQGNIEEAEKITNKFIKKNKNRINYYRVIAVVFEQNRHFEFAVELLLQARELANDPYLMARELANNYHNNNQLHKAGEEYINFLKNNKNFSNYVLSRLREILQKDQTVIESIRKSVTESDPDFIKELFALCLGEVKLYEEALEVYSYLAPNALLRFAERRSSLGDISIAERAYNIFIEKSDDEVDKAEVEIELAKIYLKQNKSETASRLLQSVIDNKKIQSRNNKYKTHANVESRKMQAELKLKNTGSVERAIDVLNSAIPFAYNQHRRKKIEFQIAYYFTIDQQFAASREMIDNILKGVDPASNIYKESFYYSYLNSLLENNELQDSLLIEIMINIPQDQRTNDVLFLTNFLEELAVIKAEFLQAYRKKLKHQNLAAIEQLRSIYADKKNEKILILAGEWAAAVNEIELAKEIFSAKFEDGILKEYAQLMLAKIEQNSILSQNFLTENPQSVFSPEFRKILEKR